MRVAVFTETIAWGGTEVNTLGYIEALAAAGHEVTNVQVDHDVYRELGPPPVGAHRAISVSTAPHPGARRAPVGYWLRLLRGLKPDVCVVSKGGYDRKSLAFDIAARLVARRYVVVEHHPAPPLEPRVVGRYLGGLVPGPGLWWWRRHYHDLMHLRVPHRVISDSRHTAEVLHEGFGLARRKTFIVHPGVDPAVFAFRPDARAALRARWGVPPDALLVGSVGRLEWVKGLERSLRAFAALRAAPAGRDAWLLLAGTGSEGAALRAAAAELGVADRLVMPGYVADSPDALSALDVYVMPSREEGFGIALVEAMACGRACVAMNSGGPADILTDPSLGWLTPADDQDAFTAATLAAAALGADGRAAMGARARAHVEAHFDHARQMRRIAELIVTA